MLKQNRLFLLSDILVLPVRNPEEAVSVLLTMWILLLFFNIFFFKTEITTLMNLVFIVLIIITSIGYIIGKRYWEKNK